MAEALEHAYVIVTCCTSVLSLLGCCTIIFSYLYFKDLRTNGRQILLCVSIVDMITALGNILGAAWAFNKDLGLCFCKFQVALHVFATNSMYFWNVSMAMYLYMTLVKAMRDRADRLMPFFHAVCWTLPAGILIVCMAFKVLGPDENNHSPAWCWISSDVDLILLWQLFAGKFWEISTYIFVCLTYGMIVCHLRTRKKRVTPRTSRATSNMTSSLTDEANVRLTFVPVVFISLRIWGTVRFLVNTIETDPESSLRKATAWLAIPQGFGDSAQGFTNCMLFCLMTARVRQLVCSCFKRRLPINQPIVLNTADQT